MDRGVPWSALCELIEPVYPQNEVERPPVGLERMLFFLGSTDSCGRVLQENAEYREGWHHGESQKR